MLTDTEDFKKCCVTFKQEYIHQKSFPKEKREIMPSLKMNYITLWIPVKRSTGTAAAEHEAGRGFVQKCPSKLRCFWVENGVHFLKDYVLLKITYVLFEVCKK